MTFENQVKKKTKTRFFQSKLPMNSLFTTTNANFGAT
jgi:hypothetical protein